MNNRKVGRPLKGNSKLETRMGFRIPNAMLKDVEAVCAEQSLNKTDFILESIEAKLASTVSCLLYTSDAADE